VVRSENNQPVWRGSTIERKHHREEAPSRGSTIERKHHREEAPSRGSTIERTTSAAAA
jgi:hypothetical protein